MQENFRDGSTCYRYRLYYIRSIWEGWPNWINTDKSAVVWPRPLVEEAAPFQNTSSGLGTTKIIWSWIPTEPKTKNVCATEVQQITALIINIYITNGNLYKLKRSKHTWTWCWFSMWHTLTLSLFLYCWLFPTGAQSAATCWRWFPAPGFFCPEDGGDTFFRNVG
jgi:hypothetical protein